MGVVRSMGFVLGFMALLAGVFAAARMANPLAGQSPFAGVETFERAGLEFEIRDLSLHQTVDVKTGQALRTFGVGVRIRQPDGGFDFTTERIVRLDELRDESGRDLLAGTESSTLDARMPLNAWRGAGHNPRPMHGHQCWAATRVEGLSRMPARLSVLRGHVTAYKIAEQKTFTLTPPEDPEKQRVLNELTPGYWFSLDELTSTDRGATWGFRDWQCNDVAPEFAGRPEVGRRRNINMQFVLGDPVPSVPGYTGHDSSKPPFLRQIRFVTAKGRVVHLIAQGSSSITRPSGIYSEDGGTFSAGRKLAQDELPLRVEVDVVIAVEPVALEFDVRNVPFGVAAAAPATARDPRLRDSATTATTSNRGTSLSIQPVERPARPAVSATPAAPREPRVMLYDIDFESPLHAAGQPPALSEATEPRGERPAVPKPRRVPSAHGNSNLPPPTIIDDSPLLGGQVLRLAPAADKTAQWIAMSLEQPTRDFGPFAAWLVEFDLVILQAGGPAPSFQLFADIPPVQPIIWRPDLTIAPPAAPASAVGQWKLNELQKVHALWDQRTGMMTLTINGERIGRFPFAKAPIKSFRLSAGNAPKEPGEAAIALVDNVRVTGLQDSAPELAPPPAE